MIALLAVSLLLLGAPVIKGDEEVKLSVYYESMCPDSIAFLVLQLEPAYKQFGSSLNVEFVPYGFASFTGEEGNWEFECQHGERECRGNIMHGCITKMLPEQEMNVPLITCISAGSPYDLNTAEQCALRLNVPLDMLALTECIETDGPNIHHANGLKTMALEPRMTWAPWQLFNDVFNEEDFENSLDDLTGVLCNKYLQNHPSCQP